MATAQEGKPQTGSKCNTGHDWHMQQGGEIIGITQGAYLRLARSECLSNAMKKQIPKHNFILQRHAPPRRVPALGAHAQLAAAVAPRQPDCDNLSTHS